MTTTDKPWEKPELAQMVRPPWEDIDGVSLCRMHGYLSTREATVAHWQQGCFDYPVANAATELEALRAEVRRLMQLGPDGSLIYHRQAANRWTAGYPHIAAALREEKP